MAPQDVRVVGTATSSGSSRELTPPEMRAWIASHTSPRPDEQNMVQVYRVPGPHSRGELIMRLERLLQDHATLRTSYRMSAEGFLVATVDSRADAGRCVSSGSATSDALAHQQVAVVAVGEFDVAEPPLIRVHAIDRGSFHWLAVVVHHIAADGESFRTIWAYLLGAASPPEADYADYAADLALTRESAAYAAQLDFWNRQSAQLAATMLEMAVHKVSADHAGATSWTLPPSSWRALIDKCRASGATPFVAVVAMLSRSLCRLMDRSSVVIGISVSTRQPRLDSAAVVGNHLNIVPVVLRDQPVDDLVDDVYAALANADVSLEETLQLARNRETRFEPQPIAVTATSFAAPEVVQSAGGSCLPVAIDQGPSKTALSVYLEVAGPGAVMHVVAGRDFSLLPPDVVASELREEIDSWA